MIGLYYYVDCNQCTTRMDQKISMEIPIFPRVLLITGVLTFLVAHLILPGATYRTIEMEFTERSGCVMEMMGNPKTN